MRALPQAPDAGPRRPDAATQIAGFPLAVLLIDPLGKVAEANPAAEELLGRSAARLAGAELGHLVALDDPRVWAGLTAAEAPLLAHDLALRGEGGARRVTLTSAPLHGFAGWRLVTLAEETMTRSGEGEGGELRAPAILAHEIKNPLAAIRGASQLLARRLEPRDRPLADIIAAEVDRIAGLLDRMQQLGTAPSGPGEGSARCNLHAAIRSALAGVRAARGDAVALEEAFDPSLPAVAAEPGALEQIVTNLVTNGWDACRGADSPRVTVKTRFAGGPVCTLMHEGRAVRLPVEIQVCDNGPGIAPDLRDHIFEPFVTGKPHGQGLGLALVRKLARDMGARITHERDEKAGLTVFRLALAVADGTAP